MKEKEQADYNKQGSRLRDRMTDWEKISRNFLLTKRPVIVRLKISNLQQVIKSYETHKLTNAFKKSIINLCEHVQQIKFAYFKNNEVSFLLKELNDEQQSQYMGGNIQKIASDFVSRFTSYFVCHCNSNPLATTIVLFEAKVFNMPVHEVNNYFIWRQEDVKGEEVCFYKKRTYVFQIKHVTPSLSNSTVIKRYKWFTDVNVSKFKNQKEFIEQFI